MRLLLLLFCLLSLACGRNNFGGVQAVGDTTRLASGTNVGKIKADVVIIQTGQSNNASTTDYTKAGQRAQSAAVGTGNTAEATKTAATPMWVYMLVGVCSVIGWEILTGKVPAKWLPWRVGAG